MCENADMLDPSLFGTVETETTGSPRSDSAQDPPMVVLAKDQPPNLVPNLLPLMNQIEEIPVNNLSKATASRPHALAETQASGNVCE